MIIKNVFLIVKQKNVMKIIKLAQNIQEISLKIAELLDLQTMIQKFAFLKIINASKRQIMFLNIVPITKEKINPYVNQFSHLKVI